jgi:hypothetical protein
MRTAWLAAVLLVTLWEIAINPIDLVAQWAYDKSRRTANPTYTVWFDDACLAALAFALLVSAIALLAIHVRWSAVNATKRPETVDSVPPRLIVGAPIQYCIVAFAIAFCPLAVADGFHLCNMRVGCINYRWVSLIYTIGFLMILGWSALARNILHILRDIVIHFADRRSEHFLVRAGLRTKTARYPIRRRIAKRLRRVADLVFSESPAPTHLLVVAHSQGTIIVLEDFRKDYWKGRLAPLQNLTLLTFGSPLTHLYEKYFPLSYGDPTHDRWRNLRKRIQKWVNVYRLDDYVGTAINSSDATWPTNLGFRPGRWLRGHTRYWQKDIFQHLREWLP